MMSENILDKQYDPGKIEGKIYEKWEKGGYFKPEINKDGKPFTIIMPPPNITGKLHIGHAFDDTLQDILIRYKRMKGYAALWVPGEDHASIATEVKVVDKIKEETGKTKQDLGREKFLKEAWDWAKTYRKEIANQVRKLGSSCDWSRERFTMDEGVSEAVKETFIRLYKKGLIYRGNRIINWCPSCKTALSDAEVEYEEQAGHLWHIKYPIKDSDEFVVIATTRPETMLGDTAVAINPDDERYFHLKGKSLILPLVNKEIPIVFDEYVDKQFGTGCVKITPCHDPNDFEVGLRHDLEQIRVFNDDGTINELGGKYQGLTTKQARKEIVKDLEELGLLEKIEDHMHNVGTCYRCHATVEPLTSLQWFVKMEPLAKPAIDAVNEKEVNFVPDRFKKIYFNWMENIKDWCISRQLWWGHRIPAYYCEECGEMVVSKEMPAKCEKCGCTSFKQDEDALDTWFSSALWPFSTLGWPKETEDLKKFYPNDVLVTGFDIIFFWVARMVFSGIEQMGEPPFHHVYIHGLVRDSQGRKMSKSLGNGIDPLEVIDKYGADVLRFSLVTGNKAGNDTRWQESKVEANRNFANKINNAARFILMNLEDFDENKKADLSKLHNTDKWIISRTNQMVKEVTANIEKYEFGIAAEKLYTFIWNEFCDLYIEFAKPSLNSDNKEDRFNTQYTLNLVFMNILKMLHPYMPFITEHIYSFMPGREDMLIAAEYPEYKEEYDFPKEEEDITIIVEALRTVRNARANMDIPPSKKADGYIFPSSKEMKEVFSSSKDILIKLASFKDINFIDGEYDKEESLCVVVEGGKIFIPMGELIDREKEIERLKNEEKKLNGEISRLEKKLSNKNFTDKAPEKVVEGEREKLKKYQSLMEEVKESLIKLK